MNRFITSYEGSLQIKFDDFELMQQAYFLGFEAILSGLLPDEHQRCIITGCHLSLENGQYDLSEGYVYFEGEIFFVPAESGPLKDGVPCFEVIEDVGEYDPRVFENGDEHDVHAIRTAGIVFYEQADDFPYEESDRLQVLLAQRIGLDETDAWVAQLEEDLATTQGEVDSLQDAVDFINDQALPHIDQSISDLEEQAQEFENSLDFIQEQALPQIDRDLSDLEHSVSTLEQDVQDIQTTADNAAGYFVRNYTNERPDVDISTMVPISESNGLVIMGQLVVQNTSAVDGWYRVDGSLQFSNDDKPDGLQVYLAQNVSGFFADAIILDYDSIVVDGHNIKTLTLSETVLIPARASQRFIYYARQTGGGVSMISKIARMKANKVANVT